MTRNYVVSLLIMGSLFFSPAVFSENAPPSRLVDAPTAGSLQKRGYMVEGQLFDGGGMTCRAGFGLTDIIMVGISYSGSQIIGSRNASFQPHVGAQVRIRLVEETMSMPAFSIGFDSQGDGPYVRGDKLNRFRNKSRGVYLVASRNYRFLGYLGIHGGINFSLENDDGDKDPSFWAGLDKDIGKDLELCGEYDFATNDNKIDSMTANRGYMNGAVKWHLGKMFILEFDLKNILRNTKKNFTGGIDEKPEPSREIKFMYQGKF
ncbi:MAG: hypothetical protein WCU00_13155 [Candidatus Latescibacterota bacterium]